MSTKKKIHRSLLNLHCFSLNHISSWATTGKMESRGLKNKTVLIGPNGMLFLFKEAKGDNEEKQKYNTVTECYSSLLGHYNGLNHVLYFPAMYKGKIGVICSIFTTNPNSRLIMGKELLLDYSPNKAILETKRGRSKETRLEHHYEQLLNNFHRYVGAGTNLDNIRKDFCLMMAFDTILGYNDRHWENYGLYTEGNSLIRFAPIYDTSCSFNLNNCLEQNKLKEFQNNINDSYLEGTDSLITSPLAHNIGHLKLSRELVVKVPEFRGQLNILLKNWDQNLPKELRDRYIQSKEFKNLEPALKVVEIILKNRYNLSKKV